MKPKNHPSLPSYEQARTAVVAGTADSIEQFIHDHEPGNTSASSGLPDMNRQFRYHLAKALSVHPEYKHFEKYL